MITQNIIKIVQFRPICHTRLQFQNSASLSVRRIKFTSFLCSFSNYLLFITCLETERSFHVKIEKRIPVSENERNSAGLPLFYQTVANTRVTKTINVSLAGHELTRVCTCIGTILVAINNTASQKPCSFIVTIGRCSPIRRLFIEVYIPPRSRLIFRPLVP